MFLYFYYFLFLHLFRVFIFVPKPILTLVHFLFIFTRCISVIYFCLWKSFFSIRAYICLFFLSCFYTSFLSFVVTKLSQWPICWYLGIWLISLFLVQCFDDERFSWLQDLVPILKINYSWPPWFRLRLPSCGPGFQSQAHNLCFFQFVLKL